MRGWESFRACADVDADTRSIGQVQQGLTRAFHWPARSPCRCEIHNKPNALRENIAEEEKERKEEKEED